MEDEILSLCWNRHSSAFSQMLPQLRLKEQYTDATIACEGRFYRVHRFVLSTCSQYFEDMFEYAIEKHPILLLQDVHYSEVETLLKYMYAGVVNIARRDVNKLIKVAQLLRIRGLCVPDKDDPDDTHYSSSQNLGSQIGSEMQCKEQPGSSNAVSQLKKPSSRERNEMSITKRRKLCESSNNYQESDMSSETRVSVHQSDAHPQRSTSSKMMQQKVSSKADKAVFYSHNTPNLPKREFMYTDQPVFIKQEAFDESEDNCSFDVAASVSINSLAEGTAVDMSTSGTQLRQTEYFLHKQDPQVLQHYKTPECSGNTEASVAVGSSVLDKWQNTGSIVQGAPSSLSKEQEMLPSHSVATEPQQITKRQQQSRHHHHHSSFVTSGGDGHHQQQQPQGGEEKEKLVFNCTYCSYATRWRYHLAEHLYTHTGERPYQCPFCPSRFRHRGTLKNHVRNHTGDKRFTCGQCDKQFSHRSILKTHLLVHGERKFRCEMCGKPFTQKVHLKTHMQTHVKKTLSVMENSTSLLHSQQPRESY